MMLLTIATGGDDLRGDSSADAALVSPSGAAFESAPLKAQSDPGWGNNTSNTRVVPFNAALPPALGAVNITLTSHNGLFETDDNWNINGIDIRLADAVGHLQCEQSFSGDPYVRLTGSAGTAGFDTPNCRPAAGPNTLYDQLTFNILTGGDDLRGDSSATANVQLPGGSQTFTLKAQSDGGWENGSDHIKSFQLNPPQPLSAIGAIAITLTSHNGLFETDDNWNIQNVHVTAVSSSGAIGCVLNQGGNPLARLTGSGPTTTLHPTAGCPDTWFPIGPQVRMQIGAPVTALWRSNDTHLDLFSTGNDGAVWSTWWEAAPGWQPWFLPHNEVKMQPGAAVSALWRSNDNHLDLFATGNDGAVWSTWWEAARGWQPWFLVHNEVKMQPGATVTAVWRSNDTHLDLFATGNDGAVWSTWWEAARGWQPWFLVHNEVKMQPGATVTALWRSNDTHLDLFATGNDGAVWSTWWEAAHGWQPWFLVHNEVKMQKGAPVSALWRSNDTHLDLFATGNDGAVWSTWWEAGPGWQPWFLPDNSRKMEPGAQVTALWRSNDTHLDLFSTADDGTVWSIWWEAASGW
jgi:hypothetical protein